MADDAMAGGRRLWGRGFHVRADASVDADAYDRYVGCWSRIFVAPLLDAAAVGPGDLVLDLATGAGEAATAAAHRRPRGVVGADVAMGMLTAAAERRVGDRFWPVVADGHCLPFGAGLFDAVVCQLGLMFFPDPHRGLEECRRVVRVGGRVAVCVVGTADRAPPWGILADVLERHLPDQSANLHMSFRLGDHHQLAGLLGGAMGSTTFTSTGTCNVARSPRSTTIGRRSKPVPASCRRPTGHCPRRRATPSETRSANASARLSPAGCLDLSVEVLVGAGVRR